MIPQPSPRRFAILGVTFVAALWMYIDRVCISTLAVSIQADLQLSDREKGMMLGAFFLTYAIFQVPVGTLADRFGQRKVLALCILGWSIVTALTGFVEGFISLLVVRLLLGVSEAGAYPAAAGLVRSWAAPSERGRFSSVVALGGRIGATIAPFLTVSLSTILVGSLLLGASAIGTPSGVNWRGVFLFYGLCGIVVAAIFWYVVTDRPDSVVKEKIVERSFASQVGQLARSRNMWLFGGVQFGTNIGWVTLVTLMPSYLKEVFAVEDAKIGQMQSSALLTGCVGMIAGGIITDYAFRKYGPRWGRSGPIGVALICCSLCCMVVPNVVEPWHAVMALGAMALFVDISNPSTWAFAQDVGGKNVGAALGWGNMWGNLGAALSPSLLTEIKIHFGWDAAFFVCAAVFACASALGFMLNSSKTIADEVEAS